MSTPKEPKELPPRDSKEDPVKVISKESLHRLLRDVKQIMMNPLTENGIYYQHCEENMLKGNAMIIGPEDTPYYGGYYFFELNYPTNYPHSPPVVKFFTQGDQIRFNPNLYKNESMCFFVEYLERRTMDIVSNHYKHFAYPMHIVMQESYFK